MEANRASFAVSDAQDTFGPGAIHDSYLTTAVGLMRGATVLAASPPDESGWAFALVSGQILECSLKAFLSKLGQTGLNGHDLAKLWARAAGRGLPIGDMPQWAKTLNSLHGPPNYHVRYPDKLNGLIFPEPHETEAALRNIIDTVRKAL